VSEPGAGSRREIAFIGFGRVGGTLADQMQRAGHRVTLAHAGGPSASLDAALKRNRALEVAPAERAVADAEVVVLATPFGANAQALAPVAELMVGRILIDCTNPVGPGLTHALGSERSGAQELAGFVPGARIVKAFGVYGAETLADPRSLGDTPAPAMPLCSDDSAAAEIVGSIVAQLGWQPVNVGGLAQALHLEHMTLLWVRMVRTEGRSPLFAWAALSA
jgi:8-hydroxy-5-deazaflavin:NADPH oxidoreductase